MIHDAKWYKTDPRFAIDKRADIVIFNTLDSRLWAAQVETKDSFCVFINAQDLDHDRPFLSADSPWPAGWVWTWRPRMADAYELLGS